jgi:hypothetical protein
MQPAASAPDATLRLTASRATLIRTAIGGPRQIAGKLSRLARTLGLWVRPGEIDARLARLEARGYVTRRPTRLQLLFGSLDMLRFVIEPASRDYYRQRGIDFGLHQLLRWLDDPCSLVDPTGFFSDRETIMGHVMQVVHLNPIYDLQLLQMFPDGLEIFEREIESMLAGTHPRARTIGAIVEEPGYHARLLDYVRRYRRDPTTAPPVRQAQTLRDDPVFAAAERTFATLPGFVAYCNALPRDFRSLRRRLRTLRAFPIELEQTPIYA